MDEMVQERRTSTKNEERYDLFSSLLDANEGQLEGDAKLSDKALLGACEAKHASVLTLMPVRTGNVFLFLVAGHDVHPHLLLY